MIATPPRSPSTDALWISYADMAVRTALDFAGRKLLRSAGRAVRSRDNQLTEIGPEHWYKRIPHAGADVDQLLDGALRFFDETAVLADAHTAACIREVVQNYLRTVIGAGLDHDRVTLARMLADAGCVETTAA